MVNDRFLTAFARKVFANEQDGARALQSGKYKSCSEKLLIPQFRVAPAVKSSFAVEFDKGRKRIEGKDAAVAKRAFFPLSFVLFPAFPN